MAGAVKGKTGKVAVWTRVAKCSNQKCIHEYQDKKYSGLRVQNFAVSKDTFRCTVCGELQQNVDVKKTTEKTTTTEKKKK